MFNDILTMCLNAIKAVWEYFIYIVDELGALPFLTVTLLMVLFVGHIILVRIPEMGENLKSDLADRKRMEETHSSDFKNKYKDNHLAMRNEIIKRHMKASK